MLFSLYDESVDDDDFALYIDRASTPVAEPDTRSAPTSRGSSVSRSGHLQPPDAAGDLVQRSSSYTGDGQRGAAERRPAVAAPDGGGGRLPRPRSAIVTRESAADASSTSPMVQSTRDDVAAAGNLLTVPSSWYRTEVATNVGTASSRLTANVQLGVPPPATTTTVTTTPTTVTSSSSSSSSSSS